MDGHRVRSTAQVNLFRVLSGESVQLPAALLRTFTLGLALSLMLWLVHSILGRVHSESVSGYLIIGNMMSFTGWLLEGVWYAHVAKMLKNSRAITGFLTRVPFWYVGGGVGYVLGMLIVKRSGLMGFYDVPVNHLFTLGGEIGFLTQILLQVSAYRLNLSTASTGQ